MWWLLMGLLSCYLGAAPCLQSIGLNMIVRILGTERTFSRYIIKPRYLGAVSIRKTVLPGMAIPMLKIRRPNGRLIFNMEITILR